MIQKPGLPRRVLHLVLIAAHDPFIPGVFALDLLAAILNPRIAVIDPQRAAQLKIPHRPAAPDQKCISLRGILFGRLPANHPIVDRPQPRIPIPSRQVLPIEQRLHPLRLGRRSLRYIFGQSHRRHEQRRRHQRDDSHERPPSFLLLTDFDPDVFVQTDALALEKLCNRPLEFL